MKKSDLSKYTKILAREFSKAKELNAMSRQAAAERAWNAVARYFLADSNNNTVENPKFYRKSERQLNRANRKKSKKFKRGANTEGAARVPQSKNYHKARSRYARKHLRVSRQLSSHSRTPLKIAPIVERKYRNLYQPELIFAPIVVILKIGAARSL